MRQVNLKKYVLSNLPYLFVGLYATKLGQAWRLSSGTEFADKVLHLMDGFAAAFQSAAPSFHPSDLLVGLCCGAALRLAVYLKGKNAKKYRHGTEYGSARWGTAKDIQPFVDPVFENKSSNSLDTDIPKTSDIANRYSKDMACGVSLLFASILARYDQLMPTLSASCSWVSPRRFLK